MFLEQQIKTLEGFLKDCVILKTGAMMLKIQLSHHKTIFWSNKCKWWCI